MTNDLIDTLWTNENSRCGFDHRAYAYDIIKQCLDECWYDKTPKDIADSIRMKFNIQEFPNEPEVA